MRSTKIIAGQKGRIDQYNKLRADAYGSSMLLAHQKDVPDLQIYVEPGEVYFADKRISFAGGASPTFTAPTTNPRLDVLVIDSTGILVRIAGTEASVPVAPTYSDNQFPICQVHCRVGMTQIFDENVAPFNQGFIFSDVRAFLNAPASRSLKASYIAGETLVKGDALFMARADAHLTKNFDTNAATINITPTQGYGQVFKTRSDIKKLTTISVRLSSNIDNIPQPYLRLYNVTGTPEVATGAPIAEKGIGQVVTGQAGSWINFTFDTPVVLTPNTKYAFFLSNNGTGSSVYNVWYNTADYYADGHALSTLTNAVIAHDMAFRIYEVTKTAGQVYHTDADAYDANNEITNNFIGFADHGASAGQKVTVIVGGVAPLFTGLTPGALYYMANTASFISQTAGVAVRKLGIALSEGELLIKHDNV